MKFINHNIKQIEAETNKKKHQLVEMIIRNSPKTLFSVDTMCTDRNTIFYPFLLHWNEHQFDCSSFNWISTSILIDWLLNILLKIKSTQIIIKILSTQPIIQPYWNGKSDIFATVNRKLETGRGKSESERERGREKNSTISIILVASFLLTRINYYLNKNTNICWKKTVVGGFNFVRYNQSC